jgi:hypothetical protein
MEVLADRVAAHIASAMTLRPFLAFSVSAHFKELGRSISADNSAELFPSLPIISPLPPAHRLSG